MFWNLIKKMAFEFDAERAHHIFSSALSVTGEATPELLELLAKPPHPQELKGTEAFGLSFQNRLGLAAGFDKDAYLLKFLPYLGFGFVEVGTVTARPQKGNPRPRLFRLPEQESLFNCLGFNNEGAEVISQRVEKARESLPSWFRVGLNIGKNKDTEMAYAHHDYFEAVTLFKGLVDFVVINVSSPNTPGLRGLQHFQNLRPIIDKVENVLATWRPVPPLLVKFSPEFKGDEFFECVQALKKESVAGIVLSNTLKEEFRGREGGISGARLTELSRSRLQDFRSRDCFPVISVGGIGSVPEAQKRMQIGAQLLEIYTAWIYRGPRFPGELARVIGVDHER